MKKYTEEQENTICTMFDQGFSPTEIAKQLNTYNSTIRRILIRNDRVLKSPSESQKIVKTNPFEDLTSSTVQYWLGFICADGNISDPLKGGKYTVDVSLAELDRNHLEKYANFIGYGVTPKGYYNKKYDSTLWSVRFGNKEVHQYLNSLGVTPAKSKTLKLNVAITWSILNGIIDGDGYVRILSNDRASIEITTGSKLFLDQISSFLEINKIHHTKDFKKIGLIRICTQNAVRKLVLNLYKSNDQFLQRKYNKLGPSIKKFIEESTTKSGKPTSKDKAIPS